MARQANKPGSRSSSPKRRAPVRRKKKGADRSVLIGGVLVALLLLLVAVGVYSIRSDKDVPAQTAAREKKETVAKREAAASQSQEPAKKEEPEAKPKPKPASEKDEDISALIRLVLFDYEISRSSVEERLSNTAGGKTVYYFNVKCYSDTASSVKEALRSVLTKKGYKVKTSADKITADGRKDSVQVAFILSDGPQAKAEAPKKPAKNARAQARAADTPSLPKPPAPADRVVKMAILLDDGGNSYELAERFAKSKYPLAIAILPHLEHTKEAAKVSSAYGKTIFLHFPMQPKSYPSTDPGEGAALVSMPEILIDGVTKMNFEDLGVPVDGFNNHMGSAITEDRVKMAQILKAAKNYTDTFIDSRTTAQSVAYDECVKAGMRCGINKKFIDNDNDVNLIIERLYEAAELAKKNGEVLVIGHIRQKTLEALEIALPILESRKIAIVPVKSMVR